MKKFAIVLIVYLAFVSLGLPDGVHGIAWPEIRGEMGLPLEYLGIFTSVLLILSAVSSSFSGRIAAKFGSGKIAFAGGILTASALLGFAVSPNFFWLVLCVIPLGLGQGSVDAAINLYVVNNFSARHMNWLHCFWGVGATIGTFVMTAAMRGGSWSVGYGVLGSAQIFIGIIVLLSLIFGFWKNDGSKKNEAENITTAGLSGKKFQILSLFTFFLYLGVEYSIGFWIASILVESRYMDAALAGTFASVYYGGIMAGRFISGVAVKRIKNATLLRIGAITALCGITIMALTDTRVGIVLIGLGLAPIFPCLMHETSRRFTKTVSDRLVGYQIAAGSLGAVIISFGMGLVLSNISAEMLFPIVGAFVVFIFAINETFAKLLN
jgi:fucose permease